MANYTQHLNSRINIVEVLDNLFSDDSIKLNDKDVALINSFKEFMNNNYALLNNTIMVLSDSKITDKQKFFMNNGILVTGFIEELEKMYTEISEIDYSNNVYISAVTKYIHDLLSLLDNLVDSFKNELRDNLLSEKEDIKITKDSVDKAQNIINEEDRDIIKDSISSTKNINIKQQINKSQKNQKTDKYSLYMIASNDLSERSIFSINENNYKEEINKILEKTNISNPRIFKLSEIKVKEKVIQKKINYIE